MSFKSLGLSEPLLRVVVELGYKEPTLIQTKSIPIILKGDDILASAQTGTGKTASFLLPLMQKIASKPKERSNLTKVLILTPTRELAAQVHENILQFGRYLNLRAQIVFGGTKLYSQIRKLSSGVELLVATPGRLLDLHNRKAIRFDEVEHFVLDEADRMLDMGFIHDIKRIIKLLPQNKKTLMFSATFSPEIRKLAKTILINPKEIHAGTQNTSVEAIEQYVHPVDKANKFSLLSHLIHQHKWNQALVFSQTKRGANKLVRQLTAAQIHSVAIHGDKTQAQRTKALNGFKAGEIHILIATDLASRGIDIEKLPCVINFDLPKCPEDYVHRIGRTGRAGEAGLAISLVSSDEANQLRSIEKLINLKLKKIAMENFEPIQCLPIINERLKKSRWRGRSKGR